MPTIRRGKYECTAIFAVEGVGGFPDGKEPYPFLSFPTTKFQRWPKHSEWRRNKSRIYHGYSVLKIGITDRADFPVCSGFFHLKHNVRDLVARSGGAVSMEG